VRQKARNNILGHSLYFCPVGSHPRNADYTAKAIGSAKRAVKTDLFRFASEKTFQPALAHCAPMVTALLGRLRCVKRTGTAGPAPILLGTRTFTWFSPKNPGALPKYRTSANRPPMNTCGGITLPSARPVQ
jgi:hypothetical protein